MCDFDKYFRPQEFVSRKVFQKHGSRSLQFLDKNIMIAAAKLREHFGRPVIVNDWHFNGYLEQRGLRANLDGLVYEKTMNGILYISPHILGKGMDFEVVGLHHREVTQQLLKNPHKFEEIKRIENPAITPGYTHIDTIDCGFSGIYMFG